MDEMAENELALMPQGAKALSCVPNCRVAEAGKAEIGGIFIVSKAMLCFFVLIQKQLYCLS